MMTGPGAAVGEANKINLIDISIDKVVCEYFSYKVKYTWPDLEGHIPDNIEIRK